MARAAPQAARRLHEPVVDVIVRQVDERHSVFEDGAVVTMTAAMRDVTNPNGPTTNNAITINRYRVRFRRSDGRNSPASTCPTRSTAP